MPKFAEKQEGRREIYFYVDVGRLATGPPKKVNAVVAA